MLFENAMKTTRRNFLKTAGFASAGLLLGGNGLSAKSYRQIIGANDRIQVALIGCNRRFDSISQAMTKCKNVEVTYVCDVDKRRQDKAVKRIQKLLGYDPKAEKDLRKILEQKDVDAIFNMTPDHWHAPGAWMAMQAGKHVYLEKPCTHNPNEGEVLLAFQKRYPNLLVQVGNQQRSSTESKEIVKAIHEGIIGEAYQATAFYIANRGRVNNPKKIPAPGFLDWELFQGPAPRTDFLDIWEDYNWHWYWIYGTAESGNNAMHELDIARWALQAEIPNEVSAFGYKNNYKDDGWTMYDTMDVVYKFPGDKIIKWDCKCRNGLNTFAYPGGRGTIIYGTKGSVFADRNGYKLYDLGGKLIRNVTSKEQNHTTGLGGSGGGLDAMHPRNFFEAIRGREKLNSSLDQGIKSTLLCHLANISYKEGNRPLKINPETGRFTDKKVMKKHWKREYEKGWAPTI